MFTYKGLHRGFLHCRSSEKTRIGLGGQGICVRSPLEEPGKHDEELQEDCRLSGYPRSVGGNWNNLAVGSPGGRSRIAVEVKRCSCFLGRPRMEALGEPQEPLVDSDRPYDRRPCCATCKARRERKRPNEIRSDESVASLSHSQSNDPLESLVL